MRFFVLVLMENWISSCCFHITKGNGECLKIFHLKVVLLIIFHTIHLGRKEWLFSCRRQQESLLQYYAEESAGLPVSSSPPWLHPSCLHCGITKFADINCSEENKMDKAHTGLNWANGGRAVQKSEVQWIFINQSSELISWVVMSWIFLPFQIF